MEEIHTMGNIAGELLYVRCVALQAPDGKFVAVGEHDWQHETRVCTVRTLVFKIVKKIYYILLSRM